MLNMICVSERTVWRYLSLFEKKRWRETSEVPSWPAHAAGWIWAAYTIATNSRTPCMNCKRSCYICLASQWECWPSVERSSSWDVVGRLYVMLLYRDQMTCEPSSWLNSPSMTQQCLCGQMKVDVIDETGQGSLGTAWEASRQLITEYWSEECDTLPYLLCLLQERMMCS